MGAAGLWGATEVAVEALGLPPLALTVVVVTSIVGFPFALVLSWFYQLTPTAAIVGFVGLATSVAMQADPAAEGQPAASASFTKRQITFIGSARDPVFSPEDLPTHGLANQFGQGRGTVASGLRRREGVSMENDGPVAPRSATWSWMGTDGLEPPTPCL